MKNTTPKRYILTGTPGCGKTSVINVLETRGFQVIHEVATAVIAESQKRGIPEPWKFPQFIDDIWQYQKQQQINAKGSLQFYDRSPFCTLALAHYLKFKPSAGLIAEIDRIQQESIYQNKIFFLKNIGYIKNTNARTISFEQALIFEKIHLEVYQAYGFNIQFIEKDTVERRCDFVVAAVR